MSYPGSWVSKQLFQPHLVHMLISINLLYNPLSLLKQMLMARVHLMFLFIRKQLITAMHIAIQPFMHLTYIYFAFNIDANTVLKSSSSLKKNCFALCASTIQRRREDSYFLFCELHHKCFRFKQLNSCMQPPRCKHVNIGALSYTALVCCSRKIGPASWLVELDKSMMGERNSTRMLVYLMRIRISKSLSRFVSNDVEFLTFD